MTFERKFEDGIVVTEQNTIYGPILVCTCIDYRKSQPQTPPCCGHIDRINRENSKPKMDLRQLDELILTKFLGGKCWRSGDRLLFPPLEGLEPIAANCYEVPNYSTELGYAVSLVQKVPALVSFELGWSGFWTAEINANKIHQGSADAAVNDPRGAAYAVCEAVLRSAGLWPKEGA